MRRPILFLTLMLVPLACGDAKSTDASDQTVSDSEASSDAEASSDLSAAGPKLVDADVSDRDRFTSVEFSKALAEEATIQGTTWKSGTLVSFHESGELHYAKLVEAQPLFDQADLQPAVSETWPAGTLMRFGLPFTQDSDPSPVPEVIIPKTDATLWGQDWPAETEFAIGTSRLNNGPYEIYIIRADFGMQDVSDRRFFGEVPEQRMITFSPEGELVKDNVWGKP